MALDMALEAKGVELHPVKLVMLTQLRGVSTMLLQNYIKGEQMEESREGSADWAAVVRNSENLGNLWIK